MTAVTELHPTPRTSLDEEKARGAVRRFFRVAFAGAEAKQRVGPELSTGNWRVLSVDSFFSASFAGRASLNQGGASCGDGAVGADQVFGEFNWD